MPRGETQEVPQEEQKDQSEEIRKQDLESNQEARRDAEIVAEPEAVVERERPVEESEAIEAAVLEAVEAVDTADDPGSETKGGQVDEAPPAEEDLDALIDAAADEVQDAVAEAAAAAEEAIEEREEDLNQAVNVASDEIQDQIQDAEVGRRTDDEIKQSEEEEEEEEQTRPVERGSDQVEEGRLSETSFKVETPMPDRDDDPPPPPEDRSVGTDEVSLTPDEVKREVDDMGAMDGKIAPVDQVDPMPGSGEGSVSATPINLPRVAEDPDHGPNPFTDSPEMDPAVLEGADPDQRFRDDDPPPPPEMELPEGKWGVEGEEMIEETSGKWDTPVAGKNESAEIREDVVLDETAFKVESPLPDDETGEVLGAEDFKPIPAEEGGEAGKIPGTESGMDEGAGLEGEEGADEGGSILIGENEDGGDEGEEVLTGTTRPKEGETGEEEWEPPEIYTLQHKDGSVEFVDANGNPINCPPHYSREPETGEIHAWYPGAKEKTFKITSFKGHDPNKLITFTDKDGNVHFYDKDYNSLQIQPDYFREEDGSIMIKDANGNNVTVETIDPNEFVSETGVMVYENMDGSYELIMFDGIPTEWYPEVMRGEDGGYYTKDSEGNLFKIWEMKSRATTYDTFVYQNQDGSYSIVDSSGRPKDYPPHVKKIIDNDGTQKYIYTDDEGKQIEISTYKPPTKDVYAYTSQDGTVYAVDKDGNQVDSPPQIDIEYSPTGTKFHSPDGSASGVDIPPYQPPIKDMFIYLNQDGSIDIVDQNGKMIESPPNITFDYDSQGKPIYMAKYAGMALESSVKLGYYKPPSSQGDKK